MFTGGGWLVGAAAWLLCQQRKTGGVRLRTGVIEVEPKNLLPSFFKLHLLNRQTGSATVSAWMLFLVILRRRWSRLLHHPSRTLRVFLPVAAQEVHSVSGLADAGSGSIMEKLSKGWKQSVRMASHGVC